MKPSLILGIIILLMLVSCSPETSAVDNAYHSNNELITFRFNGNYKIVVDTKNDSVVAYRHFYKDTFMDGGMIGISTLEQLNALKSENYSDSLSYYANQMMSDSSMSGKSNEDDDFLRVTILRDSIEYNVWFDSAPRWQDCTVGTSSFYAYLVRNNLNNPIK